jgi:TRAP-type mannitol/chloroaromatic compound transport system permease large subunit
LKRQVVSTSGLGQRTNPLTRERAARKASAEAMLTIAADPKHLGARIAITAVLHTWGSAMTAMVVFILIGARVFSLVFQGVGGGHWIEHLLTSLPGGQVGFLVFVNAFIFVIAFFLDFFEIAFIIIPLLAPVAQKLGIDLVWFGVLICANIQTSFMHPPFGFALFYLRGIAPPSIKTSDIYWGAIPWVFLQLILVVIVILWPGSVTYWIDKGPQLDPSKIEIQLPPMPFPFDSPPPKIE